MECKIHTQIKCTDVITPHYSRDNRWKTKFELSVVAFASDLYSLFIEAQATMGCFFDDQEINLLPRYKRYPLEEHWSSGQPVRSLNIEVARLISWK